MPSTVYLADMRASLKRTFNQKIDELMERVGLVSIIKPGALTALKIHFGEKGNTTFIRPVLARRWADAVKKAGGKPFFTDCNTLYVGSRSDAVNHLHTATENGFAYSVAGAPLVIADGLRGSTEIVVPLGLPECPEAYIGQEIIHADAMISIAHFKGHEVAGFGGTIKNLGMGCASRRGKLYQHANLSPIIVPKRCIACGDCISRCPALAIRLVKRGPDMDPAPAHSEKPQFVAIKDGDKCIGCGDCIATCHQSAIMIPWDSQVPELMKRMVGHAKASLEGKHGKALFFNFIVDVNPDCNCMPFQDAPIVHDIGLAASTDPVAIDQASVDLVNASPGLPTSRLKSAFAEGADKFRDIHPKIDWEVQMEYAEQVGLGSRNYELVRI